MSILPSFLENIFFTFSKQLSSIAEDNNILGRFDEFNIVTKNENFVTMFELSGISYNALNEDKMRELLELRNIFINSVDSSFNISIFQDRDIKELDTQVKSTVSNDYANNLLKLYNNEIATNVYENRFYIAISTNRKNIKNFLDLQKEKLTTSNEEDNFSIALNQRLNKTAEHILSQLNNYDIKRLNSEEVLNFYASYCNMKKTKVKAKLGKIISFMKTMKNVIHFL
jgi:type IV secretory pathway VirB4 component